MPATYETIEEAIIAKLKRTDKMILGFLYEPSVREIARALEIPKSTVHDGIKRLREAGLDRGEWSVQA